MVVVAEQRLLLLPLALAARDAQQRQVAQREQRLRHGCDLLRQLARWHHHQSARRVGFREGPSDQRGEKDTRLTQDVDDQGQQVAERLATARGAAGDDVATC